MSGYGFDTVVVGSGAAGLSAALTAAELGLRPLVLEKAARIGGGTGVANALWVGANHLAEAAGIEDSRERTLEYMRFVGGDQVDEERLLRFVDEAPLALRFFEECGVGFQLCGGLIDHYHGLAPGSLATGRMIEATPISEDEAGPYAGLLTAPRDAPAEMTQEEEFRWGGRARPEGWDRRLLEQRAAARVRARGLGLIIHLLKQLHERGVEVHSERAVERLLDEGGRVTGVLTGDGAVIDAEHGVVLATGAYESNPELAARFEGLPGWHSMYAASISGDALVMAGRLGAATATIHNNLGLFLGFDIDGGDDPADGAAFRLASIYEMPCPHSIVVNRLGQRFADESYFQTVAPALRRYDPATHSHPNLPCYLVFDAQFARQFSFGGRPAGADIPAWVARAGSVRDLAAALRVDAAGLDATVERFNGFADAGYDEDFERGHRYGWSLAARERWDADGGNPSLGALREPPFYGLELRPSAFAAAGLLTDVDARVLDHDGRPIDGLYAVGNAAAHTEYGVGYQAGYSIASGMTFGYIAARHMRARVPVS